jgi:hypothetical protein
VYGSAKTYVLVYEQNGNVLALLREIVKGLLYLARFCLRINHEEVALGRRRLGYMLSRGLASGLF